MNFYKTTNIFPLFVAKNWIFHDLRFHFFLLFLKLYALFSTFFLFYFLTIFSVNLLAKHNSKNYIHHDKQFFIHLETKVI